MGIPWSVIDFRIEYFGHVIPAEDLCAGDIIVRRDLPGSWLILSLTEKYSPRTRMVRKLNLSTFEVEEEEIESLVARFWEIFRDGERIAYNNLMINHAIIREIKKSETAAKETSDDVIVKLGYRYHKCSDGHPRQFIPNNACYCWFCHCG